MRGGGEEEKRRRGGEEKKFTSEMSVSFVAGFSFHITRSENKKWE